MMGRRKNGQCQFFYAFDLDKVVPPDHLVRQIDCLLDLTLLWQIYSRCVFVHIHFRQCGHR